MGDILDEIDSDELDFEDLEEPVVSDELELVDDEEEFELEMSEEKAREITNAIRATSAATYALLAQAHAGKAYKALGYATWADYVQEEFSITASRSYQLLDLSKAVKLIEEATPEGTEVRLTEAQARDIKRELPRITQQLKEETDGLDPEEASAQVERIIDDIRNQKKAEQAAVAEREKNVQEAEAEGYNKGLEAAADAFLDQNPEPEEDHTSPQEVPSDGAVLLSPEDRVNLYNFLNVLSGLTDLPEPDEFIKVVPTSRAGEITNQLNAATSWLNRFATLWEENNQE